MLTKLLLVTLGAIAMAQDQPAGPAQCRETAAGDVHSAPPEQSSGSQAQAGYGERQYDSVVGSASSERGFGGMYSNVPAPLPALGGDPPYRS